MASPSRVGPHSPASPRLPSPPPFPEVQIGHRSPSPSSARSSLIATPEEQSSEDYGSARRIRPGTKAAEMASGPPLVPLSELDSAFQLQEHLKSLYLAATTSPVSTNLSQPITRASATSLATPPPGIDRSLWLYELCRFLVQRANILIVGFFADNPPCSAVNCPEMRASEWQYLCAVHDPPKSCCAIDYCCHTLDWAAGVLTSQKHFPSRLTLGSGSKEVTGNQTGSGGDAASVRQLTNIFRRVYRMFAHAWFQHRDVFWTIENQEGLYIFYKTVCDVYSLIPEDNYTVPPEAEGLGSGDRSADEDGWTRESVHGISNTSAVNSDPSRSSRPSSLDLGPGNNLSFSKDYASHNGTSDSTATMMGTGATQRRHKHTPSIGSFVTTIHEGDEDVTSPPAESSAATSFFSGGKDRHDYTDLKVPKTARRIDSESSEAKEDANEAEEDNQELETNPKIPIIIASESEDTENSPPSRSKKSPSSTAAASSESSVDHNPKNTTTTDPVPTGSTTANEEASQSQSISKSTGSDSSKTDSITDNDDSNSTIIISTEEVPSPLSEEETNPTEAKTKTKTSAAPALVQEAVSSNSSSVVDGNSKNDDKTTFAKVPPAGESTK